MKYRKMAKRLAKHLERFVTNDLAKQVEDMASRHESDLANLRRERDEAVRHMGEARAKVAELETCYKNACGTIQRQSDKIEKLYSSRNWNLSAAIRCSERMALAAEVLQGVCGATGVGKVVQAVEKALELLTAGEKPGDTPAAGMLEGVRAERDGAVLALSEAGGEIQRLRKQVEAAARVLVNAPEPTERELEAIGILSEKEKEGEE